jgi:hypothetical protein
MKDSMLWAALGDVKASEEAAAAAAAQLAEVSGHMPSWKGLRVSGEVGRLT